MPLPPTSHEAMQRAIQRFQAGDRSPQGPAVGDDWLSKGNHKYVIVHDGKPYPLKEIIRLAIRIHTGADAPPFNGGIYNARPYAEKHGMTVVAKADWRRT